MNEYLPNKEYLRPDEVARLFGVSKSTIYRWIDEGRLRSVKIAGSLVRITREAVAEIIKEN